MTAFAKRNLKIYLRDRWAVFFSLLGVLIVFALYVLFLGDVYKADLGEIEEAGEIMNNWVMAGVLAITSFTTTLGMLQTVVRDKDNRIEKDFYAAPVKRVQLAGGVFSCSLWGGYCDDSDCFRACGNLYCGGRGRRNSFIVAAGNVPVNCPDSFNEHIHFPVSFLLV